MNHSASQIVGGRYRLNQRVSQGTVTELWRAELLCAGGVRRPVALKRLLPAHVVNPTYRAAMLREARVLALLDHPNIVQLVDFNEDAWGPYLVTEWVTGVSLYDISWLCDVHGVRPSPVIIAAVGIEVLRALEAAHGRVTRSSSGAVVPAPIVQRDLSPDTVVLSLRGLVKLTDFGLARPFSENALATMAPEWSRVSYLAPEVAAGAHPSVASDLYACASLLWEAIVGRSPWAGYSPAQTLALLASGRRVTPLREARPDTPPHIAAAIDRALSPSPAERPATATLFARSLSDALRLIPERTDAPRLAVEIANAVQLRERWLASQARTQPAKHAQPAHPVPPSPHLAAREELPTLRFRVSDHLPPGRDSLIPVVADDLRAHDAHAHDAHAHDAHAHAHAEEPHAEKPHVESEHPTMPGEESPSGPPSKPASASEPEPPEVYIGRDSVGPVLVAQGEAERKLDEEILNAGDAPRP